MSDETFSFRWGVPVLDGGHTDIPNLLLDNYTAAGVSRAEFLVIVHLARYQFERAGAECRPAVDTVAQTMGYSRRGLQKVLAGLEERGLLVRHRRPGRTTIYDFSGFSRAVLELSTGVNPSSPPDNLRDEPQFTPGGEPQFTREPQFAGRGEPQFTGRGEPQFTPGVNPSSSEEEKPRRKAEEEKREEAAAGPQTVRCSIHDAVMERREKDGAVWYSHRLPDGTWCKGAAGDQARAEREPITATCPACYLVRPIENICPDCGRCFGCCECEED